jgi:hypothetical protein
MEIDREGDRRSAAVKERGRSREMESGDEDRER